MSDYVSIGPCIPDQDAVQVSNEDDYVVPMKKQCKEYIAWLREKLGEEPIGARLAIKGFPHDFGTYYEVVCYWNDAESFQYALKCEGYQG